MSLVVAWIVAAIVFLALDAIWLTTMNDRLYRPLIGELLAPAPSLPPAIAFYLIYISGLVFFAISPGLERASLSKTLISAAAFGFVAYATYDLTNQATLRIWDVRITLADLAWGAFVSAAAAGAAHLAASRVN
ncbi:MAG TPA: DUF2177 family protein [Terricaulis sp.]|nr:DUF2177 family protein [Terricaulis sp.]